jgi:hypothetical protein
MKFENLVAARSEDPFWFPEGQDYWLEILNTDNKWQAVMEWVSKTTAVGNARKLVQEGFQKCVRVTKRSRYPDYPVHSVVFYAELH